MFKIIRGTFLLPKYINFGLNGVIFRHEDENLVNIENLPTSPFGMLFNNQKQKEFSFFFTPYDRNLSSNFISRICFFENLELFYEDSNFKSLINGTENILDLYYDYKEGNFSDKAITFEVEFIKHKKFNNQINDLDLLIHLYNTRKLPSYHEIHPISKHLITYRNKIVNFYSTINYFIYIYKPRNKTVLRFSSLLINLLRNTFSNGYIIEGGSYLLISTNLFKQDFENQKKSLFELIYSFKFEIQVFENLHLVPLSFYQIPPSTYFNVEDNKWHFPIYQEKSIDELLNYQIKNLEMERSKLQDITFKQRIDNYLENWTNEINSLKECQ